MIKTPVNQLDNIKYSGLVELSCDTCQKTYTKTKINVYSNSRIKGVLCFDRKTFCSKKCQSIHQTIIPSVSCRCCGIMTKNPQYCSSSCSARMSNKQRKRTKKKIYTCTRCGNQAKQYRKFCTDCTNNGWSWNRTDFKPLNLRTIDECIKSSKHSSSANRFNIIRCHARTMYRDEMTKPCLRCGFKLHVELCHIKPISSFPLNTLISTVNAPNNITFLCPNCHWQFDSGLLSVDEVIACQRTI